MHTRLGAFIVVLVVGLSGIISFHVPSLQFVAGFLSQALSPVQALVSDPARQGTEFIRTVQEMSELRLENAKLREEVARLRGEAARMGELDRENERLREQLNLKREQPSYQWLPARVVGRDANNLLRSVAINRGSTDGIAVGMTVMTPAGLVGQVIRVGPTSARVLLITDVGSSVTALIQGSRAEGVVNGQGKPYLVMRYIPQPAVIKTGDRALTSGVGGIYPSGLPIGRVTSASKKDIEPFQEALIEPEVDFEHLETVLVITNHVPLRLE
jgi:rod shape-determining protein MreC